MAPIVENDESVSVLRELWDTTRMRLLVEIGRRGSLSAAAEAVGIGQPSASQHVRLLEAAAGQRLVERSGRGSRLTEAGEVLAARAAQALTTLQTAEEELAALSGLQSGTIHLGASSVPGIYLLPEALDCFRTEFPAVTVEVKIGSTADVLERLIAGDVQIALVGVSAVGDRVELRPLVDDELVGIMRPGLLPVERGVVARTALADRLLLCREPGSASRAVAEEALERAEIRFAGRWELGASEAVKRAVREGLGVAFLSRFAVAEEVARDELEAFRVAGMPPIRRSLSVATVAGRDLSPAEQSFTTTLASCCTNAACAADASVGAIRG
jgi:LysR family transcriptional regulator, low CO2-responsive transcriptional regulator